MTKRSNKKAGLLRCFGLLRTEVSDSAQEV